MSETTNPSKGGREMARLEEDDDPRSWIHGDESAKTMLARVHAERPFLLLPPPLHHVPLRVGNVVEITGPSGSGKSQALLQATVQCILPKEWKGIPFGGLEKIVIYFDLDCRFDVLRLSQILRHRIIGILGSANIDCRGSQKGMQERGTNDAINPFDDELLLSCMKRFVYIRCYSSSEFVAALKTMHCQAHSQCETLGVGIQFLIIDSIGAFYLVDRAYQFSSEGHCTRRNLSFQDLVATVVHELRKLLEEQPVLVLATKSSNTGAGYPQLDIHRAYGKWENRVNGTSSNRESESLMYREYMPSLWQALVSHRIHVQASDNRNSDSGPMYTSEWVQPPLHIKDGFDVRDDGISLLT